VLERAEPLTETENNPVVDKVRELQRKLWVCAKQSRTRRFHALYDRIYRSDVLREAWRRVRSNGGAAGVDRETLAGTPQGGVISPGKGSFVFLGCTIRKKRSILRNPRAYYMHRWPSPKATKRLRDRVREITGKRGSREDVKQIIAKLNPVLRGWGNYFRTGTCRREFHKMDDYVFARLTRWQHRRGSQRAQRRTRWTGAELYGMGLYQLRRTVRCAAQAAPVRSSLSRVRENRTHGLKGVC
jgi:hypothetical protein